MEKALESRCNLAFNVKKQMKAHGITSQRHLSRLSGISPPQIKLILDANVGASIDAIQALAEAFGLKSSRMLVEPEMLNIADESTPEGALAREVLGFFAYTTDEGRRLIYEIARLQPKAPHVAEDPQQNNIISH
jgi:hypothetical protein